MGTQRAGRFIHHLQWQHLFSVDYPYSTNEQGQAFLENTSISPADKEKISHLNAERLLKLSQA
jgi:uncharacterized protein